MSMPESQDRVARSVNVLLGITGSVAAIKRNALVDAITVAFNQRGLRVCTRVVLTRKAQHFRPESELSVAKDVKEYRDEDEWVWQDRGDPVLHIELAAWADIGVIAPLDACTASKLANGLCDNLLTCTCIAWQHSLKKPLVLCPSMNTHMYENEGVQENLRRLERRGLKIIKPIEKRLMCGTTGIGAMQEVDVIADKLASFVLNQTNDQGYHWRMAMTVGLLATFMALTIRIMESRSA